MGCEFDFQTLSSGWTEQYSFLENHIKFHKHVMFHDLIKIHWNGILILCSFCENTLKTLEEKEQSMEEEYNQIKIFIYSEFENII